MIKDHYVEPIGIIIVVERQWGSGVDNGFIGIARINTIKPLIPDNFYVINPEIIKGWNHYLGAKLQQILVGYDVFKRLSLNIQSGGFRSFFALFHNFLCSLAY